VALLPAIAALFALAVAGPAPAQSEGGSTAGRSAPEAAPAPQMQAPRGRRAIAARRASARTARGGRTRVGLGMGSGPRAPRGRGSARSPSPGTLSARPPSYTQTPDAPKLWRAAGPYWATILMAALYLVLLLSFWKWARLRGILLAPLLIFAVAIALSAPLGYSTAVALILPYLLVLLALWNWVRTRRLALFLLLLLATGLLSLVATAGRGGIQWPYPAIVVTVGVAMLLIRLWPRWRLLRSPLPKRLPPRTPVARGVLDSCAWPNKNVHGVTTVSVLIAFVMVLVVAGAAVSCLGRAAQVSRGAQRSFVATTLLEGEFERLRAGAVTVAEVERDLSLRASRLLPNAGARAGVARPEAGDLLELDLEVSWQETGRPRRTAGLAGLVYTGG